MAIEEKVLNVECASMFIRGRYWVNFIERKRRRYKNN